MTREEIADLFRARRHELKLRREDVAFEARVSLHTVARIENRDGYMPKAELVVAVAVVLKLDHETFEPQPITDSDIRQKNRCHRVVSRP